MIITWNDSLNVDDGKIDNEHRYLVNLINKLIELAKNCDINREELKNLFSELRSYTVVHFCNEEEYMRKINYPGLAEQEQEHKKLQEQVKNYQNKFFEGEQIDPKNVYIFMKNWLVTHILSIDMKIKDFEVGRRSE
jgi:hemerythrin-like metal-binding protein